MSGPDLFSVYGQMTTLPGRRDEVIALIKESARAGGSDSGLLSYSINTSLNNPDALWVTELWTHKDAHDATTHSAPVVEVTRRFLELLAEHPVGYYGHAVHVEGQAPGGSL